MAEKKVVIIGGGLTGLSAAYFLKENGIEAKILEARSRLGGRIFTKKTRGIAAVELGATWLGKKHSQLIALLNQLGIDIFEQFQGDTAIYEQLSTSPPQLVQLPENTDPSFRIKGGSMALINALANQLSDQQIEFNRQVTSVHFEKNVFHLKTDGKSYEADILISTLPPNLLLSNISFSPSLPKSLFDIAQNTHTWMGESIKVGLTFSHPFWKESKTSGTIFSNVGPISEMYDHSNYEQSHFALKGFLNSAYYITDKAERQAVVLKQLKKYFGDQVENFQTYEEYVWRLDPLTFTNYKQPILPHQNNGHPIFREQYFDGKFIIGGSETAPEFPGYMDGAMNSAKRICLEVLAKIN